VIAPASFTGPLQALLAHKNATNMPAILLTVEQARAHFPGADDPERIKRAIAYARERLGTRYVLLAGDASLVPVRYRFVSEATDPKVGAWAGWHDGAYSSADLYYANLYSGHRKAGRQVVHSGRFHTWDGNRDGKFNEQRWGPGLAAKYNPDRVDGYPDVAVGRVPAHTEAEMKLYVDKVIRYETGKGLIAFGQDRYVFLGDKGYPEGLGMTDRVVRSVWRGAPGGQVERIALSYGPGDRLPAGWRRGDRASIAAAAQRAWWLSYTAHGYSHGWALAQGGNFDSTQAKQLRNRTNWPIVYAHACETGQFAFTAPFHRYRGLDDRPHWLWYYKDQRRAEDREAGTALRLPVTVPKPHPYDFPEGRDRTVACAWLFGPNGGGAIAYVGATVVNNWHPDLAEGMLARHRVGGRVLGDLWLNGQRAYWWKHLGCGEVFGEPRIWLNIMNLFGDPSLRLPRR
jgi:hypothetical protein